MFRVTIASLLTAVLLTVPAFSQTAATGAIVGTVTDANGGLLPNATVVLADQGTGVQRKIVTDATGVYRFSLVPPGKYSAEFSAPGFATIKRSGITVNVSETASVNAVMQIGTRNEVLDVTAETVQVQQETSSLGRLISERELTDIPLTNRNYTQMLHMSAGVSANLTNAAQVGRNTQDVYVHGATTLDNNYQMDGAQVNNAGTGRAGDTLWFGGIPVPNPDAIQEFNIQTGQYDAGSGRSVGANVNVVTKSGTNSLHGSVFEYFRNDALNANDYFLNQKGQPRPAMKQNQFGFTLGGPIKKDKLFFFGSYQGTRQVNGLGATSLRSVNLPPLTNDRSAEALGAMFAGQQGVYQPIVAEALRQAGFPLPPDPVGPTILPDGSNINPVALALLQYKLPNGNYLIPTPQRISTVMVNGAPTPIGQSTYSVPSHFTENQMIENIDYAISQKHTFSTHWFSSWVDQQLGFPTNTVIPSVAPLPGSGPSSTVNNYSLTTKLTSTLTNSLMNEARFSFLRNAAIQLAGRPVTARQVGMTPGPLADELPSIQIPGLFVLGADINDGGAVTAEAFQAADQIAWTKSKHNIRAGFQFQRNRITTKTWGVGKGILIIPSFADFLLGLPGCNPADFPLSCNPIVPGATTGVPLSNLIMSVGFSGLSNRHWRANDYALFVQDDYKIHPQLTLNLGLRWEVNGYFSETNGYMSNLIPAIAASMPPPEGTYSGFLVPSNYKGDLPGGVTRNDDKSIGNGTPMRNFGPRVGLAWRPLASSQNLVVHAGYGIFYTRPSSINVMSTTLSPPYYQLSQLSGPANYLSSLQVPFNPAPPPLSAFPLWTPRTPTSNLSALVAAPKFLSPMAQQWSLNVQYELKGVLVQAGYVGSHITHAFEMTQLNEAQLASPQHPINGETTNTLANIYLRAPVVGVTPDGLRAQQFDGMSSYNGLELTARKRLSHGLQLQASYTFSKTLTNQIASTGGGMQTMYGGNSQRTANNGRGEAEFSRPQRFVLSYLYRFPNFHGGTGGLGKLLGGWEVSGVTTFQSGNPLTLVDSRAGSIYGANNPGLWYQPANFCSGASNSSLQTSGSVQSRLDNYINASAVCPPPVVSVDGGTGYGNMGRGVLRGPGQNNWDISLGKITKVKGPTEAANLEFRAQFFNAFNHPQFDNPLVDAGAPGFGTINASSVSPRLIQLALKYNF